MSETAAGTQQSPRGRLAATGTGHRTGWVTPVNVVIAVATVVAFGLRLYHVLRPGLLSVTQYDDGPYFGSAVLLVHGYVPYRDYVLIQPPGITLLMSPVALLTRVVGTAWGLAIGRILTAVAGAAAVALGGLLVRRRGLLTLLVTCGIMAVYPDAVAAAHTVMLEPWLVLFCLIGALAVFDGDRLTTATRRLAWGGAAFGFAGAVKAWAIVPVVVIFLLLLPTRPGLPRLRRAAVFTGGVAAGFLVPVLPFAALAPRRMYDSVVATQLSRVSARIPLALRLRELTGITSLQTASRTTVFAVVATIVAVIVTANVVASRTSHRPMSALDWFAAATAVLVVAMFSWPPYFASHYSAFLAPFLALAVALPLSRLAAGGRAPGRRTAGGGGEPAARVAAWWLTVALAVLAVVGGVFPSPIGFGARGRLAPVAVGRVVPPGACVLSDQVSYLLLANRFVSSVPGCPVIVDGLGSDLVLSGGLSPATGAGKVPAVAAFWRQAFARAQYLVLSKKNSLRIAWAPTLRSYFHRNFTPALARPGYTVYARNS